MAATMRTYDNCGMMATKRCDRCGAQAYVEVQMSSDKTNTLLFCAHDYKPHEEKLKEVAVEINDHRKFLALESAPA